MGELFVVGLAGSLHCVGMCGGFVLALDRPRSLLWRRLAYQGLFHLGKTTTYVLLGALVGLFGHALRRAPGLGAVQAVLAVVTGVLMILAGLQIAGWLRSLPLGRLFGEGSAYDRSVKAVINMRGPLAPISLGVLTGFLPCPLVYAFLAHAAGETNVLRAMASMSVLGATSMLVLLAVALAGASFSPLLRARAVRIAGIVVIVLGVITVLRGVAPDLLHGGAHDHAHHGSGR